MTLLTLCPPHVWKRIKTLARQTYSILTLLSSVLEGQRKARAYIHVTTWEGWRCSQRFSQLLHEPCRIFKKQGNHFGNEFRIAFILQLLQLSKLLVQNFLSPSLSLSGSMYFHIRSHPKCLMLHTKTNPGHKTKKKNPGNTHTHTHTHTNQRTKETSIYYDPQNPGLSSPTQYQISTPQSEQ